MSKIPSILLFLGPEDGLRGEELDSLRSHIAKESGAPADEYRLYLPDGTVGAAIDLLRNGSLFAAHRLVIISGSEQIRKKEETSAIESYCAAPPEAATLVLVSDAVRLDAKLEKVVPPQARKVFWELFDNQKRGWVQSHFRKRNVSITSEAVELFLELVENNTRELRTEADKLIVYAGSHGASGSSAQIDVDEIEAFVFHSRDENVFTLYKTIVEDDFEHALEIVATLQASGEGDPVQLVGGLIFQLKKLVSLRTLVDNGFSHDEAFRKLAIRGKRIQADYRDAATRFDVGALRHQLQLLIEFDATFRELGSGLHRVLIDLLVYQLMFPGGSIAMRDETDVRLIG